MSNQAVEMALGRIFGMMQRPFQPGDVEEYERCRALVMDAVEPGDPQLDYRPNYARDYRKVSR